MSQSDFMLTAGIDFTGAQRQVDKFVQDTERKVKRLSDIMAKATSSGGSFSRGGAGAGGSSPRSSNSAVQSAIANERAYQAALTRTESMVQRIAR